MSQACFACTTPYQIMGAVSIVSASKITADLLVFGMFDGYESLASAIRETGLFSAVITVAPDRYRAPGRTGAVRQMAAARAVTGSFLPEEKVYDLYYSSSRAHIKNILLHELIRRNPELKIIIYDDGMGTYAGDSHVLNTTNLRKKAEHLLGWDLYRPERTEYLVYEPALFTAPEGYSACPVRQMPKPGNRRETMRIISDIFHVTPQDEIGERVIIFDPLRGKEREKILPQIDSCYREVVSAFGRENVIIKPHPRSASRPDADAKIYTRTGIPMEALYARMEDLNDRILVTYASTAVYTPRMLFAKEPRVIALFRITDGDGHSEWHTQYEKFRGMYSDQEKMTAPGTMEELKQLLHRADPGNAQRQNAGA